MHIDHERAKHAYEQVRKSILITVTPKGIARPPENLPEWLYFDRRGNVIEVEGPITEEHYKGLKDMDPSDGWQDAVGELWKKSGDRRFARLKTLGTRFPAMLQSCGLIQTVAFYQEKANKDDRDIYRILQSWLCNPKVLPRPSGNAGESLMERLNKVEDVELYRLITREAMAYMTWVKRALSVKLADVEEGERDD